MTNYVPSLPDCEKWKKLISEIAKGRSESKSESYVKSDSPLSEIKVISHTAGDIAIAKSRMKTYKDKKSKCKNQRSSRSGRVKRSKKRKGVSQKSKLIKKRINLKRKKNNKKRR
jgi:hypothetical protein